MIAIAITDRLGNQMFQYAAARALALKHSTILKIDRRYYDRNPPAGYFYGLQAFNIEENLLSNREIKEYTGLSTGLIHKAIRRVYPKHQKRNPNKIFQERFFHYDPQFAQLSNEVYLRGYWQSYKYFDSVAHVIRNDFTFLKPVDQSDEFVKKISATNSVCVSVRRGDHLWHPVTKNKYGSCNSEYYHAGLEIIREKNKDLELFVFSDDIEWCIANVKFDMPTVFVKNPEKGIRFDYYLQLMAFCRHFIIPVSTFPWWGAWLSNSSEKIVIAPKVWFKDPGINTGDLIPDGWYRI